jgi:predicted DNA-binding protein
MNDEQGIKYPVRSMRLSDEVWESLKVAQKHSGKSWNLFIKELNADESL